jgi:hypothetical protein
MSAAPVAPFLERPATQSQGRDGGDHAFANRDRAGAKDCTFRAFIFAGDPAANPRTRKLAQHQFDSFVRRWGSTRWLWRMFPAEGWDSTPTLGWENLPCGQARRSFSQFSAIGTLLD